MRLTCHRYRGADRDKQIPNTLFRTGGAATLLTNKACIKNRSKYVLEHIVKVHQGADATSYRLVARCARPCFEQLRLNQRSPWFLKSRYMCARLTFFAPRKENGFRHS